MRQEILNNFLQIFGAEAGQPRIFFAPGRVNLIGEHIDYNGGLVMPCALSIGTYGAIRKRSDNNVKLISGNLDSNLVTFSLDKLVYEKEHMWGNYPKGVLALLKEKGYSLSGFDMYVWGNLPSGAGLSSSASLNTLVALALNSIFDLGISPIERAKLCQAAEGFNNVNCGIMDPFACTMGEENHAMLLNCATLEYEQIPLNLGEYQIVIANTNYRRGLADSKYNERRAECEQALADIQKVYNINELCDLTPELFEKYKGAVCRANGYTLRNRVEHVVYENYRTKEAAHAMKEGNLSELLSLMRWSHLSLRELYEVTGKALDALADAAIQYGEENPDCIVGARMTGAGFGGCTVNIIKSSHTDNFIKTVGKLYRAATDTEASFYVAEVSGGAKELL